MSTISAGNTTTTSIVVTGDTTGNLIFTTSGANTTALTLDTTQTATFAGNVAITSTGFIQIPTGTTAQRPTANSVGYTRYNTTFSALESWSGTAWVAAALQTNQYSASYLVVAGGGGGGYYGGGGGAGGGRHADQPGNPAKSCIDQEAG